jgi:hypothetical protein
MAARRIRNLKDIRASPQERANAMTTSPVPDSGTSQLLYRKPLRRTKITTTIVTIAAAGLLAVLAVASGSSSDVASASTPDVLVNSFSGESAVASGTSAWQWITGTDSESFASAASRGVITGSVVLGSSNGAAVSGRLGVCYQAAGGAISNANWEIINFTAPAGQWVTQTVSGTAVPSAAGTFTVGLCAYNTSANLTYSTAFGAGAGTVIVAINSGP